MNVLIKNLRLRFWKKYKFVFSNCKYNTIQYNSMFLTKAYKILPFSKSNKNGNASRIRRS